MQTLLRTNRRIALLLIIVGIGLVVAGLATLTGVASVERVASISVAVWVTFFVFMTTVGVGMLSGGAWMLVRPRLALRGAHLEVNLGHWRPWSVPLEFVECFFIGQHAAGITRKTAEGGRIESATVVVRLAQRAADWKHRRVAPHLGVWDDGYITVFGTWCEPIDGDFVKAMNHQLAEVRRQLKKSQTEGFESSG